MPDAKIEVEAPDLETVKRGRKDQGPSHIGPHVLDICQKADLVFLGLHGMDGEDGRIQAALDLLGVPYTARVIWPPLSPWTRRFPSRFWTRAAFPPPSGGCCLWTG